MTRRWVGWRLVWVGVFAIAFAFVESSVVVYLRALYYPDGFSFPLQELPAGHLLVEVIREAATIVMLAAVAFIAGTSRWERFGQFLFAFGIWDLAFYLWLKVILDWPASFVEWDILFLIPLPWIGPVIAPVLVALLMAVCGTILITREARGETFRPGKVTWVAALLATALILGSFLWDTDATLRGATPRPYRYELLIAGLLLYAAGFAAACKTSRPQRSA